MSVMRNVLALGALAAGWAASPAAAQFYLRSHAFEGATVRGDEPGVNAQALPGATEAELRAGLVWNMRAALNVAALQCQFEPTLLTVANYNALLADHRDEFKGSFDTLTKYFTRINKAKGAGQKALDQFGTRTYSSFVTVGGQFGFCQTAAAIGRDAVFVPRGEFAGIAAERMQQLRASLLGAWGEQAVPRYVPRDQPPKPRLDPECWSKKGEWVDKKCGPINWPPAG